MNQPAVYISCVSPEFRQTRSRVAAILARLGYTPVIQEIFGTEAGDLRQVPRHKIDACAGYQAERPTLQLTYRDKFLSSDIASPEPNLDAPILFATFPRFIRGDRHSFSVAGDERRSDPLLLQLSGHCFGSLLRNDCI